MPSTYTLNNGIELIATGEQSGTWGDTTNTNFELLDTSLDGQVTVTLASTGSSGSPNTLPVSDGAASNGRNRLVIFDDSSDLGGTAFVQLTPSDAEKIIYVRNSLSGSRSILLFQGTYNASNDYEVPAGTTAVVFFDGAGAGAVAANVFNNAHFDNLNVVGDGSIEGTLSVDTINEFTSAAGVTIDSVLLKDDVVNASDIETSTISANDGTTAINIADSTGAVDIDTSLNVDGTVTADGLTVDGTIASPSVVRVSNVGGTWTAGDEIGRIQFYSADGSGIGAHEAASIRAVTNQGGVQTDGTLEFWRSPYNASVVKALEIDGPTGDITFYESDGTTASFVYDANAGVTFNEAGSDRDFRVESDGNSNMLFVDAGENAVKIGGTTTREGQLQIFTNAGGVAMEIESTNGGSGQGPILQLRRTSSSPAGNDYLGGLNFVGQDSGNNALSYVDMYTRATTITDGSEESQFSIRTRRNGNLEERFTLNAVETTFNEVGGDIDFRVESDGKTHALFVDGTNNFTIFGAASTTNLPSAGGIGISATGERGMILQSSSADTLMLFRDSGTSSTPPYIGSFGDYLAINRYGGGSPRLGINETSPEAYLHISGMAASTSDQGVIFEGAWPWLKFLDTETNQDTYSIYNDDALFFSRLPYADRNDPPRSGTSGGTAINHLELRDTENIFNNEGADIDFRVESDNSTHALFVNAAVSRVGIKTASPDYELQVGDDNTNVDATIAVASAGSSSKRLVFYRASNKDWEIVEDTSENLSINSSGITGKEFVINNASNDTDFRVESDSNTHSMYLDAATDMVNFRTSGSASLQKGGGMDAAINVNGSAYLGSAHYRVISNPNGKVFTLDTASNGAQAFIHLEGSHYNGYRNTYFWATNFSGNWTVYSNTNATSGTTPTYTIGNNSSQNPTITLAFSTGYSGGYVSVRMSNSWSVS